MPNPNDYYVYVAQSFDTIFNLALRFGITDQQIRDANPQWKNRIMIFLNAGEEVIMPAGIENSPMFWLYKSQLIIRQRKASDKKEEKPAAYPPDWFPPKPNFGSPSVHLSAFLAKLGNPKYKVNHPGVRHSPITFTDGWNTKNVSYVEIPQLKDMPIPIKGGFVKCSGRIQFYTKAHQAIQQLFKAWEDDGLLPKILTFDGSFVPRVIKSTLIPSNHSFGTAFDINAEWNPERKQPVGIGKKGCLLELVPKANELGFFWGGFYSGNIDGMHFEYAKL